MGIAAISLTAWSVNALFFVVFVPQYRCSGELCGLGLAMAILALVGIAVLLSAITVLSALSVALRTGDWITAAAFGVLLTAAAVATYVLLRLPDGRSDHPLLTALYGFPPNMMSSHPLAYCGSAALVALQPLLVLPYALTREHAQRVSAAVTLLLVLVFWLTVRLTG